MKLLVLASCFALARTQCGPDGSRPYPPGSSTCPTRGQQMPQHQQGAPGGMPTETGVQQPTQTNMGFTSTGSCTTPPCAASMLGDVGKVTVSGIDARTGTSFAPGENIYGPFEAGFNSQQDFILADLGCSTGRGYVAGGIDTYTAEQMVAQDCGVTLPRIEGNAYISLLDECGGHTREYHFHERLSCLYTTMAGSGHSTQVGQGSDGKYLYGKWELYSTSELPQLDACGGHFGVTPDSNGIVLYHYHVQDKAPFTFGCYGPIEQNTGEYKMVTLSECRAIYSGCGDGDTVTVSLPTGSVQYDLWCPCYDSTGSNVGTSELPVFSGAASSYTCIGGSCIGDNSASSPSPSPPPPTPSPTPLPTPSAPAPPPQAAPLPSPMPPPTPPAASPAPAGAFSPCTDGSQPQCPDGSSPTRSAGQPPSCSTGTPKCADGSDPAPPPSGGDMLAGGLMMGGEAPTAVVETAGTSPSPASPAAPPEMSAGVGLSSRGPPPTDGSAPGRGVGGNVHVSFGDVADCSGACGDYTITEAQILASLDGFTAFNGGTIATSTINYYGDWWTSNVGTRTAVSSDFCSSGSGASQTGQAKSYLGVTFSATSDSVSLGGYSVPNHDVEDYCSAEGGETPPMIGTTFTMQTKTELLLSLSTRSRADISNSVGVAVNSVIIFSPFTGIGTIAPYDETLDTCSGHPANGQYHYHGFSPCIHGEAGVQTGGSIAHSKIYGWAYDGFPIYGPYGYTDGNDASSTVVRVTGGYTCTVGGQACTEDQKKTASNWAWDTGNGMLDACNGRFTKTPEFPDGMYVYVLNVREDGKPEFPGVPYCQQGAAGENTQTAAAGSPTDDQGTVMPDKVCTAEGVATAGTKIGDFSLAGIAFQGMKSNASDTDSSFTSNVDGSVTASTKGRVYLEATAGLNSTHNGFRVEVECVSCPGSAPAFDRVAVYMEAVDACGGAIQYSLGNQPGGNVKGWLYKCDYLRQACGLDCKSCDSPVGKSTLNTMATKMGMWIKTDAQGSLILENGNEGAVSYTSPYIDADSLAGIKISSFGVMLEAGSNDALSVKITVEGASGWNEFPQAGYTTASGACARTGEVSCTGVWSVSTPSPTPSPPSPSPSEPPAPTPSPSSDSTTSTTASPSSDANPATTSDAVSSNLKAMIMSPLFTFCVLH